MKCNKNLLTKALLSTTLIASSTLFAAAQISFGGEPASFSQPTNSLRSAGVSKVIEVRPDFNPDDVKGLQAWDAQQVRVKPLVIGRAIATDINFARDAERITLDDGTVVYRLTIDAKNAKANILYYDDFFIPQDGGELFIYTPDRKTVLGKYTYETHPKHGAFATEPLPGTTAILEYKPALNSEEMPSILISSVGHIFAKAAPTEDPGEDQGSDDCSVNINCKEGAEWQDQKAGVVQMIMYSGGYVSICSGDLLNNTNEDFTPYIISAAHCESLTNRRKTSESDLDQWIFTFHYEKMGCSSGSFALGRGKTMVGCDLMAFLPIQGQSDGLLLKLDQMIPDSYRVYYNGWDRSDAIPNSGVGIHHPAGDAKKLSVYNGDVTLNTWHTSDAFGGPNAHFFFHFTKGETEGGSSGSSLWNEDKLVVGTLTGGGGRCQSGTNFYGRLNYHWDKYKKDGDATTQMASFLDPKTNGQATKLRGRWKDEAGTLRPLPIVSGVKVTREGNNIKVTWDAIPRTHLADGWKVKYNISRNGRDLDKRTEATEFIEPVTEAEKDNHGSITYGIQARYEYGTGIATENPDRPERYAVTDWVEQGIYIGEKSQTVPVIGVSKETSGGVRISWNQPYNLQEVTLFGAPKETSEYEEIVLNYTGSIRTRNHRNGYTPTEITFASKFPTASFDANGSALYVHGIRVIPTQKLSGVYKAYVHSSKMVNSQYYVNQPFDVPSNWAPGQWVTVLLQKPIAIDLEKVLFAGVTIPNKKVTPFPSISFVKYTSDAVREYIDGNIALENGEDILSYSDAVSSRIVSKYSGYAAISILVSNVKKPMTSADDQRIFVTGKNIVPFPKVKGFTIKRNGTEIANVEAVREYVDKDGSENDTYTVEVKYEDGAYTSNEEITTDATEPTVFPTTVGIDGLLHVTGSDALTSLAIYTMDGKLVKMVRQPASTISMEDVAAGNYIVVLDGTNGRKTQRIIR
nr:T9SS type A sorting domain-containing protein [uncultured Porphyromonas sp.]